MKNRGNNRRRFNQTQQKCADWLNGWLTQNESRPCAQPNVARAVLLAVQEFDQTVFECPDLDEAIRRFESRISGESDPDIREELQVVFDAMRDAIGI